MERFIQLTILVDDDKGETPLPREVASEVVDALAILLNQVREAEESKEGKHDKQS